MAVRLFRKLIMRTFGFSLCSGVVKKIVYTISTSSSRVLRMVKGAKMIGDETGVLFWKARFLILLKAVAAVQSVTETRSMIV